MSVEPTVILGVISHYRGATSINLLWGWLGIEFDTKPAVIYWNSNKGRFRYLELTWQN